MLKKKTITRFFILLSASFLGLILLFTIPVLKDGFKNVFLKVEKPVFNMVNPHIYVDFLNSAPENKMNWDVSFKVWDEKKHDQRLYNPDYRLNNTPNAFLAQNSRELFLVPFIFLLALLIATPVDLKKGLIKWSLSIFAFLLFMALYLSYRFEYTLYHEQMPLNSLWHLLISFFGLGGNIDPIFIVVFFIWLFVTGPMYLFYQYGQTFFSKGYRRGE